VNKRVIRSLLLGVLALTIASGSVLSTGALAGQAGCCCGDGSCPTGDPFDSGAPRCCEATTPAPAPIAEAGGNPQSVPDQDHRSDGDHLVAPTNPSSSVPSPDRSHGPGPPGVSLHTLHSVFLI